MLKIPVHCNLCTGNFKKMLAKKMDINLIMEITGLTKEEIEKI